MRKPLPMASVSSCRSCSSSAQDSTAEASVVRLQAEMMDRIHRVRSLGRDVSEVKNQTAEDSSAPEILLSTSHALPLVDNRAHYVVDGRHLWVAVDQAGVLVLDDTDNKIFETLLEGNSAEEVVTERVGSPVDASVVSREIGPLLGRIVCAGFLKGFQGLVGHREPTPHRFARFHLTKSCQLNCVHCYADSSPQADRSGEQPTSWWHSLIDQLSDVGLERVLFTGGEALMHRGCIELMAHARSVGLRVTLFTNGLLVPRVIDRLVESCHEVQVSLDGPTADTNDMIRGRGVYGKALRALELLLETELHVRVGMTTMASNWEAWRSQFLEFADRFADTDLEYRLSFGLTEYGRADGLGQQMRPEVTQPEVERLLKGKKGGFDGPRVTRRTTGCGYFEQIVVGPDGTLYPCHLLDTPIGHVDDQPMQEWVREITRLASLFSVDHTEGCSSCGIRYLCGGTCRVLNAKKTGSRLVTTCTDADKERRYRNIVRHYSPVSH